MLNNKTKINISLIVFLLLFPSFIMAIQSSNKVAFRSLMVSDGLSMGSVNCMLKDNKGFLWIGTYNGLNRYDGYEIKNYFHNPHDSTSLSHNSIRAIIKDEEGFLWIGTHKGLNRFDPSTETSLRFFPDTANLNSPSHNTIVSMCMGKDNRIWCATLGGGVYSVVPKTLTFEQHRLSDLEGLSHNSNLIRHVEPAHSKEIWLCTRGEGVLKYNPENRTYKQYLNYGNISQNYAYSIRPIKEGLYIFGTKQGGIFILDEKNQQIETFQDYYQIELEGLDEVDIYDFLVESPNSIWILTRGAGLIHFNASAQKLTKHYNHRKDPLSIVHNRLLSFYKDETGIIWFGTRDGISYIDPHYKKFDAFNRDNIPEAIQETNAYGFVEQADNRLLVNFFGYGFAQLNLSNGEFLPPPQELNPSELLSSYILSSLKISNGDIIMGTRVGIMHYRSASNRVTYHCPEDSLRKGFNHQYIHHIFQDSKERIWLGSGSGLEQYHPESGTFTMYTPYKTENPEAVENFIWSLEEDLDGNILVGTDGGGLCIFDPSKKEFIHKFRNDTKDTTSLSNNRVISLHKDKHDRIWVGTSKGLNLFSPKSQSFRRLTTNEGLKSDVVFSILNDDSGNIWFATVKTLCQFLPEEWEFIEYDYTDGIQKGEFISGAAYKLKSGHMLFGGLSGFNYFHPDSIRQNPFPPQVSITEIHILNEPILDYQKENKRMLTNKAVPYADSLVLKHDEKSLTFRLASLSYSLPTKNKYQYKLENFDEKWFQNGNNRIINYTNLSPGEYTLKAKVCNNDGLWSEPADLVYIKVKPPLWNTLLAKILYVAFVIGMIVLIIRFRTYQLNKQKKTLEEQVALKTQSLKESNQLLEENKEEILAQKEELEIHRNTLEEQVRIRTRDLEIAKEKAETSEKLKSAFLENMSHEIRTPLNAIVGFSSMLDEKDLHPEDKNHFVNMIKNSSDDLLFLINDLLDLSQIETGVLNMNKGKVALENSLHEMYLMYQKKAEAKGIELSVNLGEDSELLAYTDEFRLKQVLRNLIENALKFTEEGAIELGASLSEENGKEWIVHVKDSGVGIPKNKLDAVFERFIKIHDDPTKLYRGAGLGLTISKKIMELLEGKIWVESEEGKYANFFLTLPVWDEENNIKPDVIESKRHDWTGKNILVAEDEFANFLLMSSLLERRGVKVHWAKNGQEALDILHKEKIHLGIIDIKMPVMDGFTFMKNARSEFQEQLPPMIAHTAYTMAFNEIDFEEGGFSTYVYKPFKTEDFLATIDKYL